MVYLKIVNIFSSKKKTNAEGKGLTKEEMNNNKNNVTATKEKKSTLRIPFLSKSRNNSSNILVQNNNNSNDLSNSVSNELNLTGYFYILNI